LRAQPEEPQSELKTQARDDQDLRPEPRLTRHLRIVEVGIRVFTGIGRQSLGSGFPERCETVVARRLAGDDIVELSDAGRAPHARIDRGHLGAERIDIDQRLALEAVDRGNDEVGLAVAALPKGIRDNREAADRRIRLPPRPEPAESVPSFISGETL